MTGGYPQGLNPQSAYGDVDNPGYSCVRNQIFILFVLVLEISVEDAKGYMNFSQKMIIKKRYKLHKKIGKGTFSKVFAAQDLQTGSWVALKVVRNTDKYQMAAKLEAHILTMILRHDQRETSNCIHLIDQFVFQGHPCFVFKLLGKTFKSFFLFLFLENHFLGLLLPKKETVKSKTCFFFQENQYC